MPTILHRLSIDPPPEQVHPLVATRNGVEQWWTGRYWKNENEFMSGCSTNWGAYLTSLNHGVEGRGFSPYPASEISRWS
jgi:hypothetical protein